MKCHKGVRFLHNYLIWALIYVNKVDAFAGLTETFFFAFFFFCALLLFIFYIKDKRLRQDLSVAELVLVLLFHGLTPYITIYYHTCFLSGNLFFSLNYLQTCPWVFYLITTSVVSLAPVTHLSSLQFWSVTDFPLSVWLKPIA